MPSRKNAEGEYHDIAHPINQESRAAIEKEVFMNFYDEIYKLLEKISIDSAYELNFDVNNIFKISLRNKDSMEVINTYELVDYTDASLKNLEETIKNDLSRN